MVSKNAKPTAELLYSDYAEQSVIGGLLLDNNAFDEIGDTLEPGDFYLKPHRVIFEQISSLLLKGTAVDLITLDEVLKQQNLSEPTGGFAYLADVAKNTPSAANIKNYADVIKQYSRHRQLLALGQHLVAESTSAKTSEQLEALIDYAEKGITQITLSTVSDDGVCNLKQGFQKVVDRIEAAALKQNPVSGTPTGIAKLDEMTTGGQPGDLILIAARPSMGKTAFSQNIAWHTLETFKDKPIQYFSMEMPADHLLQRFISMLGSVSLQAIRQADTLTDYEWAKISETMKTILDDWQDRLLIDDESSLTPQRLRTKSRKYAREYGKPSAIFVDYVQLMRVPGKSENRNLEIAEISRSLKALAKEMECPVYALSQLNRNLENRTNKRPVNSDLRESGALEQDADVVLFLYRDEVYYPESEDKGLAEIIIGKQRNGPIGKAMSRFAGEFARFENLGGQDNE